ncbi:hypothetical protein T310_6030, partial [Rasamsonia emersonii CBS 393.64]
SWTNFDGESMFLWHRGSNRAGKRRTSTSGNAPAQERALETRTYPPQILDRYLDFHNGMRRAGKKARPGRGKDCHFFPQIVWRQKLFQRWGRDEKRKSMPQLREINGRP